MTDEEYVRGVWKDVDHSAGIYNTDGLTIFAPCQGYAAAAEFTREHEEKVRQLREEMAMLCGKLLLEDRDMVIMKRVLDRLKAALADLIKGMKEPQA